MEQQVAKIKINNKEKLGAPYDLSNINFENLAITGAQQSNTSREAMERKRFTDIETLERLKSQGIEMNVQGVVSHVSMLDPTKSVDAELMHKKCAWVFFKDEHRETPEQVRDWHEFSATLSEHEINSIHHMVVRSAEYESCAIEDIREASNLLMRNLRIDMRKLGIDALAYGLHHVPKQGGKIICLHVHVMLIGALTHKQALEMNRKYARPDESDDIPQDIKRKLQTGDMYADFDRMMDAEDESTVYCQPHDNPTILLKYMRNGTAKHIHQFDDEHLARYYVEVSGPTPLHRYSKLGRFYSFCAEARRRVRYEKVIPPRSTAKRKTGDPCITGFRMAWVDGVRMPCMVVRTPEGYAPDMFKRIEEIYDISGIRNYISIYTPLTVLNNNQDSNSNSIDIDDDTIEFTAYYRHHRRRE